MFTYSLTFLGIAILSTEIFSLQQEQEKQNELFQDTLEALHSLPSLPSISSQCKTKGKSYRVDCNTCKCVDGGNLKCTNYFCISFPDSHERDAYKMTGKPCREGESIDYNCVKCSCWKSKLKCHTVQECQTKTEVILMREAKKSGQYLHIRDPKSTKCEDYAIYRQHCNTCVCQNGSLVCTKKGCMNYSETKKIMDEYAELKRRGR